MADLTCPQCGTSVAEGTTFCPSCGEMILAQRPAPAPQRPSAPPTPEPQVVPVPQRPTQQQPAGRRTPPTRSRYPVPGPPAPPQRTRSQQWPPQQQRQQPPQQWPPQTWPPQQPGGLPPFGRQPRVARRRGGCGTMLLRLLLLALAVPVLLRLLTSFLGGGVSTGSESSAPYTPVPTVAVTSDDVLPPSATTATTATTTDEPTAASTSTAAGSPTAVPTGTASASASTSSSSGVDEIIDGVLGSSTARPGGATATYPTVTLTGRECGRDGADAYAAAAAGNDRTTCAFAVATRAAYRAAGGAGRSVSIAPFSEARGAAVRLACTGAQPVRCTGSTGALVYLYGGKAVFR